MAVSGKQAVLSGKQFLGSKPVLGDKALKAAVDRFLKAASFTAQSEIEKAVRAAIAAGMIEGHETITTAVALSSEKIGLNITIYNKIEL
jgi:hypothetical protein